MAFLPYRAKVVSTIEIGELFIQNGFGALSSGKKSLEKDSISPAAIGVTFGRKLPIGASKWPPNLFH